MPHLTHQQRQTGQEKAAGAAQGASKSKNRLTAMREAETLPEPPKAYETCLCTIERHGGKLWLMKQTDCPIKGHGIFVENLDFKQNHHLTGGAVKRRNRRGCSE